jgi:hypothetical protein
MLERAVSASYFQSNADKRRLKTKNLHLSYRRPSALIGGQIAFFSSLLERQFPLTPLYRLQARQPPSKRRLVLAGIANRSASPVHGKRSGWGWLYLEFFDSAAREIELTVGAFLAIASWKQFIRQRLSSNSNLLRSGPSIAL